MRPLALELNDRALAIATEGRVLSAAPSVVFDGSGSEAAGKNAWQALRHQPRSVSTRHLGAIVGQGEHPPRSRALLDAELSLHLSECRAKPDERIWIAAPARFNAAGLGEVLSIVRNLGLTVDGFVDAAAVSVAALRPQRDALVLELGLHHLAVTAVDSNGQTRRRRAVTSARGGLLELYDAWLDFISAAMVKRTRFDPLHNAASEQQLFDALPALSLEATTAGSTVARLTVGSESFEASLSRDQFAAAAQPIYREMLRLLHALRPAGAAIALVLPQVLANAPGLREQLESFVDCELIPVPDGFAAAATSLLDLPPAADGEAVRLLRRLPSSRQAELTASIVREPLGGQRISGPAISHLLFEGKAYALQDSLTIGRAPDDAQSIKLPEGLAGVSRRHCTLIRDGGEIVLVDHSSYGTRVNGERVAERVRVYAGDRIRLGDPGVEVSLLSLNA